MAKNDWETDGTKEGYPVYCPVNGWDCPYFDECGKCHIKDPVKDCDDFAAFFETWDEWRNAE